jgi:hypothetical protein
MIDEYKSLPYGSTGVPRRVLGILCIVAGIGLSIIDVFSAFSANGNNIWALLVTGSALLGIGVVKNWSNRTTVIEKEGGEIRRSTTPSDERE